MVIVTILCALLVLILPLGQTSYHPHNTTFSLPNIHHAKRWLSVPLQESDVPTGWGPWPRVCANTPEMKQPVRYCFTDARSEKNLKPIVETAVANWGQAILHSTLDIGPDYIDNGGGGGEGMYCADERVNGDALWISDDTRDGDDTWNWGGCDTSATTGYDYGSTVRGRHTLAFCHLKPEYEGQSRPWAIRAMMHEIGKSGHAIGLQHEHQRSDRENYLNFKCKNLDGYDAAVDAVYEDAQALFEGLGLTEPQQIQGACSEEEWARAYFPAVLPYIVGSNHASDNGGLDMWNSFRLSTAFDYDSIMMYDSSAGSVDPKLKAKWVLFRKDKTAVYMGGDPDPAKAQISAGDIARVNQLYFKDDDAANKEAMDTSHWGAAHAVKVRIRDTEIVVLPPKASPVG